MQLTTLTARQLKIGIKNGKTAKDFCAECNCTEKEFEAKIRTLYTQSESSVKDILKQLDKNRKKVRRMPVATIIKPTEKAQIVPEAIIKGIADATVEKKPVNNLKALEAKEAVQSNEVQKLESEHKALCQKHRQAVAKLRTIVDEISELRKVFGQKCHEYEATVEKSNEIVSQMNSVSKLRREKLAELEETRQQISECKKVTLFVYRDGTIATMEENEPKLDDTGSDKLYQKLLESKECEELSVKNVKTLARLFAIVRNLESRNVDIVYDESALEEVYKILFHSIKTTQ